MTDNNKPQSTEDKNNKIWDFLIDCLYEGEVEVVFEKQDGTMRVMTCTLQQELIHYEFPEDKPRVEFTPTDHKSSDSVTVWDTESEGWRKLTKGKIDSVSLLGSDDDE